MRIILVVHRYLGVAVGLLMALWCLSGFVMIYQGYPRLAKEERLRGLTPLRLSRGGVSSLPSFADSDRLTGFRIEMLAGRPVLRTLEEFGREHLFDLHTGARLEGAEPNEAMAVARAFGAGNGVAGAPIDAALIRDDQWTVEGASRRGPVYRIRFDDPKATELYVTARTGEAAQVTTRHVRFWSYLGAVPHWLYPTVLRRNGPLWSEVVVWMSLAGVFLTLTGAYVGIVRLRRRPNGRWSPYRGWFYWHHLAGLVFGLLTLTWVASGLFTMNPWGFLDTPVGLSERMRLAGEITGAELRSFLAIAPAVATGEVVQLEAVPLGGRLFVMAVMRDGQSRRLNTAGVEQPLLEPDLKAALGNLGGPPLARLVRLDREDAYYYSGYQHPVTLPVYRAELADPQATTYYLDAATGRIEDALDAVARQSRWLRTGLHDIDFSATLRQRPLWDIVVLVMLTGATVGCITGAWIAIRRTSRDLRRVSQVLRTRAAKSTSR